MKLKGQLAMGEVDGDVGSQHRRPSPTSVQQLLDLVHIQKQTTHHKKHTDKVLSSRSLAPLPAIGRKGDGGDSSPRDTDQRYLGHRPKRKVGPSKSFPPAENDDLQDGYFDSPRQETNAIIYKETPVNKPSMYSMRREGTNYRLPPLSELQKAKEREIKAYEMSQERAKAQKRSANIEYYSDDPPPPRPVTRAGSRMDRPRTSRGRRKMPSPESMDDYGYIKCNNEVEVSSPRPSRPQRPKSARGRRQPTFIGRPDDYGDGRPQAPSPPSPGLYSDDEELNKELRAIDGR